MDKINVISIYKIGLIVRNIEKKIAALCKYFNIDEKLFEIMIADEGVVKNAKYYGKPMDFNVKVANIPFGNIELELIEPLNEEGPFAEFLREHGEGVQHLNIDVDKPDLFRKVMKELSIPEQSSAEMPSVGESWAYYDTSDIIGTILELGETEK